MPDLITNDAPRTECKNCGKPIALTQRRTASGRERWVHVAAPVTMEGTVAIQTATPLPDGSVVQVTFGQVGCRSASYRPGARPMYDEELDYRWVATPTREWRAARRAEAKAST